MIRQILQEVEDRRVQQEIEDIHREEKQKQMAGFASDRLGEMHNDALSGSSSKMPKQYIPNPEDADIKFSSTTPLPSHVKVK